MFTEVDESAGSSHQSYHYTRTVEIHGRVVRARIVRDFYARQSLAVAEVLTDQMTWTVLAEDVPGNWWEQTAGWGAVGLEALRQVAEGLLSRAAKILAAHSAPPVSGPCGDGGGHGGNAAEPHGTR